MKLFIKDHVVVKGGAIKEAGETYDTGVADRKQDAEAFDLIRTGKAVQIDDKEGVDEAKAEIKAKATAKETAAAAAKAAKVAAKAEKE